MCQYFKFVFNSIHFILFNYFVCLSFCDKQSFEVLLFNDSALEIIENIDSNSSLYNEISSRNISNINTILKSDSVSPKICNDNNDCMSYELCCPYDQRNNKVCVKLYPYYHICRGVHLQECNSTADCETRFGFECLPSTELFGPKRVCQCRDHYSFDAVSTKKCQPNASNNGSGSAMQIYKITMIFASCCLALILIIFLVCILRKSYCAPRRQVVPLDNSTIPDIFTLFPHVGNYDGGPLADGTLPPFEKPPTYDETLTLIRNEIGIPPPAYRSGNTPDSSNQSSPSMSTRVLISNPSLFAINSNFNSRTNSGQNSSSDESLAVPSGSGTSHQGIDNPAFC